MNFEFFFFFNFFCLLCRLLSSISLAFNFFGSDGSVEPALSLPRLSLLTLYGNPLLGPTGEDTSGIYVEDLYMVSEDIEQRLFPQRHLKVCFLLKKIKFYPYLLV